MDVQALRDRLRDYEHVIDTMNCGLVAEDLDGVIAFINQRFLDWLGYEREEVLGQSVYVLVPAELRELMDEDMRRAQLEDLRARLLVVRRKDGTTFPVVSLPQRFLDPSGNHDGYFHVVVDLGAVLTARQLVPADTGDVRAVLHRIALELQSLSLMTGPATPTPPLHHPALEDLSPREGEVLSLLVSGDRVPAIAERLHISQHTVRNHLKSMYRKLGVGKQAELIERVRKLTSEGEAAPEGAPGGAPQAPTP